MSMDAKAIIEEFKKLPPDQQQQVMNFILNDTEEEAQDPRSLV